MNKNNSALPVGWKSVKLMDVATLINGRAYKKNELLESGPVPVLRVGNFFSNRGWYYSDLILPEAKYCEEGDLLFAWSASFGPKIWDGPKVIYHYHIWKIVTTPEIDKKYLYYLLDSISAQIKSEGNGIAMIHATKGGMEQRQIPLPPLIEQQNIVAILDAAEQLRKKNQQLVDQYTNLSQSLFLEMFGDPIRNPKGWNKKEMGGLFKIERGGSPRPIKEFLGGTYPWIKIGDGTKGGDIYLDSTKEYIIEAGLKKTRLLPSGSIIFANCGVSLGFARIITFEGCIHDGWLSFSDMDEQVIDKIFLLKALNSITNYFRATAPDGTQPNLNISIMKKFELILPPVKLQHKFVERLEIIEKQKIQARDSHEKSESLFNSLLQHAFKGELTISRAA